MSPRRRKPPKAPTWYQTTRLGVWYLDVGDRVAVVFRGVPGSFWWRAPGSRGGRCDRLDDAQAAAELAAAAWRAGPHYRERTARRRAKVTPRTFVPSAADRAAADRMPRAVEPEPVEDLEVAPAPDAPADLEAVA